MWLWRSLEEAWWSCSGWLGPALFMSGRMEVEESPDLLVCYQLTTIGHLLSASLSLSLSIITSLYLYLCVVLLSVYAAINNWISIQVFM